MIGDLAVETQSAEPTIGIEPYLGNVRLSQLSSPMVREFEDKLRRGDMPEGATEQPRSPAMVRKVRVSLSSLL
jgi:integrase